MVSSHRCQNQIAVLDDHFRPTFEKATEPVRMIGDEREKPMHQDNHNAAANGCEKSRAAINRARQDGRQDNNEHGIKRRLAGERALMPYSNHGQGREENDDPAERDSAKRAAAAAARKGAKRALAKAAERVAGKRSIKRAVAAPM